MSDFRSALESSGMRPGSVAPDGRWHRCATDDKPRRRNGAYCLALDGLRGWWRNWATDNGVNEWRGLDVRTAARRVADENRAALQRATDREQRRRAVVAARAFWARCALLTSRHPYIAGKGLSALGCAGLRVYGEMLVVPVTVDGALTSVQSITPAGEKRFWKGAPVRGGAYSLLRPRSALLCIVEGLATGLAVFQAVRQASVIVAFDAGNLLPVVDRMRPTGAVVIAADNDHRTAARVGINPGLDKARNAAELIGCGVAAPSGIEGSDWADALKEWGDDAPRRIEREILAGARFVMGAR